MGTVTAAKPHPGQLYAEDKPAVKAHLALCALQLASLTFRVNTSLNIVLTAAIAVYAGCWRSVKPAPPQESMTKKDAMRFPLVGSCVLFGLFLCFKFLPKELVNALLAVYLGGISVLVLASATAPYVKDCFPEAWREKELKLPPFHIPKVIDTRTNPISLTVPELAMGIVSAGFCVWYFMKKHWLANNTLGLAFCLEGIEHMSLGSVHIGAILLSGLFIYDIFWVFCTPVMVSVAKNFDGPIKLLFPRLGPIEAGKRPFAMLGLGDIVIPGMFVALILRYDVMTGFKSRYFQSTFFGYVLGLASTIFVMNYFQAAQPALLYIVPSVLGCLALHAWAKGEFMQVFDFSEAPEEEAATDGSAEGKEGQADGEAKKEK